MFVMKKNKKYIPIKEYFDRIDKKRLKIGKKPVPHNYRYDKRYKEKLNAYKDKSTGIWMVWEKEILRKEHRCECGKTKICPSCNKKIKGKK